MRELVFGTILVAAAGAGVYFMPIGAAGGADGYAMSVKDAKLLLGKADLRKGKQPFGGLDMMVTSPSDNVVAFTGSGSFAAIDCRATLKPHEDGGITAETKCSGGSASDGAASSAVGDLHDLAFAEFVDAALDQRPFDENKVQMQSAGAVLKNMPKMQKDALKMQRDISQMEAESGSEVEGFSSDAEVDAANPDF